MHWYSSLTPYLPFVNAAIGLLLAHVIARPKDHERAALIAQIAADAAALALVELPANSPYSTVIAWVVQRLKDAGLTKNAAVLEQAAAAAVARAGFKQR